MLFWACPEEPCDEGRVAQLVERVSYTHLVIGSSPIAPTSLRSVQALILASICYNIISDEKDVFTAPRRFGFCF